MPKSSTRRRRPSRSPHFVKTFSLTGSTPIPPPLVSDIQSGKFNWLVLVYADYCSHCVTLKEEAWSSFIPIEPNNTKKVVPLPSNVRVLEIEANQLSAFRDALPQSLNFIGENIQSYPSIFFAKMDKKQHSYTNEKFTDQRSTANLLSFIHMHNKNETDSETKRQKRSRKRSVKLTSNKKKTKKQL